MIWIIVILSEIKFANFNCLYRHPPDNNLIEVEDKLAVIGEPEHFNELEQMAKGKRGGASGLSDEPHTSPS